MSPLSPEDRRALLDLARRSISVAILEKKVPEIPRQQGALAERAGAFVTLQCGGKLRGCVGIMDDPPPLAETVIHAAVSAALADSRFAPLAGEELAGLEIEISVLSQPEPITVDRIVLGLHGLLVVSGKSRGVLLPQVAVERNWTGLRFLEETCDKAGLSSDTWKDPAVKIFAFTAEVFSDDYQDAAH